MRNDVYDSITLTMEELMEISLEEYLEKYCDNQCKVCALADECINGSDEY